MSERYGMYPRHHRPHAPLLLLFAAVAMLLCARTATAGTPGSPFGRHFVFAFPDTVWHLAPFGAQPILKPQTLIVIFSLDTAHVEIKGPFFQRSIVVLPGSTSVVLPAPTITWSVNAIL